MSDNTKFPFNTYWSVPEGERDIAEVQRILVAHGFDASAIPEPTEKTNASRCAKSFQNRRGSGRKTLADTVGQNDAGKAVYALLDRENHGDSISYDETTRIEYDAATNTVNATGTMAKEYLDRLDARFRGKYCAEDIRAWLLKVVTDCSGVPKRPSGGIYLVAGRFRPVFEQVQDVLGELSTGAELFIERVWMGEEESFNIRASVSDFIGKKLDDITARANALKRESALTNLGDEAKKLADIEALFTEALNLQSVTEDVGNRVNGIGDILQDAMAAIADAKAQKKAQQAAARAASGLPATARSATPVEVADEVARQLATANDDMDVDAMAVILKSKGFITKTSTVFKRVQRAIADGYAKVSIANGKYHLVADGETPIPAEIPEEAGDDEPDATAVVAAVPEELPAELPETVSDLPEELPATAEIPEEMPC